MLVERITRFVDDSGAESFDRLALDAFEFQYERVAPFRRLCDRRSATPDSVDDWRRIPAVPTLSFRTVELAAAAPAETFRSSGTTQEQRSVHFHPYPDLYRRVIDASFPAAVLSGTGKPAVLSLIPPLSTVPDSSLSFMIDHIVRKYGSEASAYAIGRRGVDTKRARSWLAARQRDGQPSLLLATSLALSSLLDALDRLDLRFRLPAGTRVFDTGGLKGRSREVSRGELLARIEDRLAVPATEIVREYGMTELTSQFYTRPSRAASRTASTRPTGYGSRFSTPSLWNRWRRGSRACSRSSTSATSAPPCTS